MCVGLVVPHSRYARPADADASADLMMMLKTAIIITMTRMAMITGSIMPIAGTSPTDNVSFNIRAALGNKSIASL